MMAFDPDLLEDMLETSELKAMGYWKETFSTTTSTSPSRGVLTYASFSASPSAPPDEELQSEGEGVEGIIELKTWRCECGFINQVGVEETHVKCRSCNLLKVSEPYVSDDEVDKFINIGNKFGA